MTPFTYHTTSSIADAVAILDAAQTPKMLAGGQTLLPQMREFRENPSDLVRIAPLLSHEIKTTAGALEIGAGATHHEIASSTEVQAAIPALATLSAAVGDVQVRHRGTLGGALAANDPAGEYPAAALALDAVITTDRQEIQVADLFAGAHRTVLAPSEIILAVRFAIPHSTAYRKILDPAARWPMVGVFIAQRTDGWRIAVTGAHREGAFRHTAMEEAFSGSASPETALGVETDVSGFRDTHFGDPEYRGNLVAVLASRCMKDLQASQKP